MQDMQQEETNAATKYQINKKNPIRSFLNIFFF